MTFYTVAEAAGDRECSAYIVRYAGVERVVMAAGMTEALAAARALIGEECLEERLEHIEIRKRLLPTEKVGGWTG